MIKLEAETPIDLRSVRRGLDLAAAMLDRFWLDPRAPGAIRVACRLFIAKLFKRHAGGELHGMSKARWLLVNGILSSEDFVTLHRGIYGTISERETVRRLLVDVDRLVAKHGR